MFGNCDTNLISCASLGWLYAAPIRGLQLNQIYSCPLTLLIGIKLEELVRSLGGEGQLPEKCCRISGEIVRVLPEGSPLLS
jgi:hypothetical protein